MDIVVGADTKKIRDFRHDRIRTYGVGQGKPKRFWRRIVDDLLAQQCLALTDGQYPGLRLTAAGGEVLYGRATFEAMRQKEAAPSARKGPVDGYDEALFEQLRAVRRELAEAAGMPPFVIFSDRTLHQMAHYFPFREIITAYAESNPDSASTRPALPPAAPARTKSATAKRSKTLDETWRLLQERLSLAKVADHRGLAVSTIVGHIEQLLLAGRDVKVDDLVSPQTRTRIEQLFLEHGGESLNPIIEAGGGDITYAEARIVRAAMQAKEA